MNWSWKFASEYYEREYGVYADWLVGFFECPGCGEPIYKENWGDYGDWEVCPVCGFTFTEGE